MKKSTKKSQETMPSTKFSPRLVGVFVIVAILVSAVVTAIYNGRGVISGISMPSWFTKGSEGIQSTERAANSYVDPRDVFTSMKEGKEEFVVIDLRQEELYKQKYIKGTVNVPFSADTSDGFAGQVKKIAHNKRVILIPYSHFSTTGEFAAQKLTKAGVKAHIMNIGINELFNLPHMWLPEDEWQTFKFDEMVEYAD